MDIKDNVCSYENLYKAMMVTKRNVLWKDSVAGFVENGLVDCLQLHDDLMTGRYRIGKYSVFEV